MSVDTRHKRFSIMTARNSALRGITVPLFEADAGGIEADDRAHLLGLYSGIALASPVAVTLGQYRLRRQLAKYTIETQRFGRYG